MMLHTEAQGRRRDKEIEDLVVRMAREKRSWRYDRIQAALHHLDYTMSDQRRAISSSAPGSRLPLSAQRP